MSNHVSIRLDEATVARIDALGALFSTEWRIATRSDILRALILSALERYEAEHAPARVGAEGGGSARPEGSPGERRPRRRKRAPPSPPGGRSGGR